MDTNKVPDWKFVAHLAPLDPLEVREGKYEIYGAPTASGGKAIRCLACGFLSMHPRDVAERYCANCVSFHDGVTP